MSKSLVHGKASSEIPKGGSGEPKGPKQSSGKTQHERMKMAAKVENLKGMPTVHN